MKKHNFNAGPSILPREVIEKTAQAILDYNGSGLSLMEISHRAKDFQPVVDEAVALFKELLNIPEGYSVLFLGGGASMEFCMVPYNFLEKFIFFIDAANVHVQLLRIYVFHVTNHVVACLLNDCNPFFRDTQFHKFGRRVFRSYLFRAHLREEQHFLNGTLTGHQHYQTVHTDTHT